MGWRQQWRKGARVWGTWGSGRGELGSWPWQPWLGTRTRGRGRGVGDLSTEVSWPVREASGARISTGEGRGDDSWALQSGKTFGVLQGGASVVMPRGCRLRLNLVNKYCASGVVWDLAYIISVGKSLLQCAYYSNKWYQSPG